SRRRHTRFSRDWSSDVCSSDLFDLNAEPANEPAVFLLNDAHRFVLVQDAYHILYAVSANGEKLWNAQLPGAIVGKIHQLPDSSRSEERRVGKECRSWRSEYHGI